MNEPLERFRRFSFLHPITIPEGTNADSHAFRAATGQGKLKALVETFIREMKAIKDDSGYTDEGKKTFYKKAVEKTTKELAEIQRLHYEPLLDALAKLRGEASRLKIQIDPTEFPSLVLREQEIRGLLKDMDAAERFNVIQQAVAAGDESVLKAALLAPKFLRDKLLNEKVADEIQLAWMKQKNPGLMEELQSVEEMTGALAYDIGEITAGLNKMAGIVPDMREHTREQLQNQA